jgi:hypothetical protein
VNALDTTWSNSISSYAKVETATTETVLLHYPIIGQSVPSVGGPADDFCIPRTYSNNRCTSGFGHSGLDMEDWGGTAGPGEIRAVAAMDGTVFDAGCTGGLGYFVKIDGNDGKKYRQFHLDGTPAVSDSQTVKAGQFVGYMGQSGGCSNTGQSLHTHFDRFDSWSCGNGGTYCARDPYRSVRDAYARPGLRSDGSTVDNAMAGEWLIAIASLGVEYEAALQFVGYPVRGSVLWSANAVQLTSSAGNVGYKQWLGTGSNTFDAQYRAGALTHRVSDSDGYWVRWGFWKTWRTIPGPGSEHSSYLGWPITDEINGYTQFFEGGCIVLSGSTYVHARWGTPPCVLF